MTLVPDNRLRGSMRALAACGAALTLAGCGSDSSPSSPPTPAPTPPPTVQTVVTSGSGSVRARVMGLVPFTVPAAGTLDATVDWTFTANDVNLYLMSGSCTPEQFNAQQCTIANFAENPPGLKPERLTFPGASPGSYVLGIGNLGPGDESVSFQVVLTTGGLRGQ